MSNAYASRELETDSQEDSVVSESPAKDKPKKAPSAFRTISEVADELDVQQHVLRFWETKFSQVRPLKRGGGRRYYRPEDVELLKRIHHLLYTEGYTIKGVQKLLKGQGKSQILASTPEPARPAPQTVPQEIAAKAAEGKKGMSDRQRELMKGMLDDLKDLRDILKSE